MAWTEVCTDGSDVVLYPTAAGREVARRSLPCWTSRFGDGCPHSYVMSDGLVFVSVQRGVRGWDPLGLTRSPDEYFPIDATELLQAHGRTVMRPSWMEDDTYAGLPPGWTATEPVDENALLSFDGDWLLNGLTVTAVDDPDQQVVLDPPGDPVEAQFDLDGSVLVVTHVGGGFQVVDCGVGGGSCTAVSEVESKPMRLILTDN